MSVEQSKTEKKYFLDHARYNCPFCRTRSVEYSFVSNTTFHWSKSRVVYIYVIKCNRCGYKSAHFSKYEWSKGNYTDIFELDPENIDDIEEEENSEEYDSKNIDKYIFRHQPTSYFTIDTRIPPILRALIGEAEGCRGMNYLVGASGALRKAIYELLKHEEIEGEDYKTRIKSLKEKHPRVDNEDFDILAGIQGMTSNELHEQSGSFEPFSREDFDFVLETVKNTFTEMYVGPILRRENRSRINDLMSKSSFRKEKVNDKSEMKDESSIDS